MRSATILTVLLAILKASAFEFEERVAIQDFGSGGIAPDQGATGWSASIKDASGKLHFGGHSAAQLTAQKCIDGGDFDDLDGGPSKPFFCLHNEAEEDYEAVLSFSVPASLAEGRFRISFYASLQMFSNDYASYSVGCGNTTLRLRSPDNTDTGMPAKRQGWELVETNEFDAGCDAGSTIDLTFYFQMDSNNIYVGLDDVALFKERGGDADDGVPTDDGATGSPTDGGVTTGPPANDGATRPPTDDDASPSSTAIIACTAAAALIFASAGVAWHRRRNAAARAKKFKSWMDGPVYTSEMQFADHFSRMQAANTGGDNVSNDVEAQSDGGCEA